MSERRLSTSAQFTSTAPPTGGWHYKFISSSSADPVSIFNRCRSGKKLNCIQALKINALLDCITAPQEQERCQEIHPLRPRDFPPCFPLPLRFPSTLQISRDPWDFPWPLRLPPEWNRAIMTHCGTGVTLDHFEPCWIILRVFDSFKVARIINPYQDHQSLMMIINFALLRLGILVNPLQREPFERQQVWNSYFTSCIQMANGHIESFIGIMIMIICIIKEILVIRWKFANPRWKMPARVYLQ